MNEHSVPEPVCETPQGPPSAPAAPEDLRPLLQEMADRLSRLENAVSEHAHFNRSQQNLIDQLHGQLREAQADLVWKILRPVLLDLVKLHDHLGAACAQLTREDRQNRSPAEVIADFRQDVEDILYRQGVSSYTTNSERFDGIKQQVALTRPASSPEEVGQVVERLAVGFASAQHVLRKESVVVLAAVRKPNTP